jgi:hypothetical protein
MTRLVPTGADTGVLVRRGLVALTVIGILGAAFELYSEHHWNDILQLVPWAALVVLAAATVLAVARGGRGTRAAQVLAVVVLVTSIAGVIVHIVVNYDSATLDQRFADSWDSLPLLQRWWYAASKTVGPAPTLAPGMIGQSALVLLLATLARPRQLPR